MVVLNFCVRFLRDVSSTCASFFPEEFSSLLFFYILDEKLTSVLIYCLLLLSDSRFIFFLESIIIRIFIHFIIQ